MTNTVLLTPDAAVARATDYADIPWWAVALLGERYGMVPGTIEFRMRAVMERGVRPSLRESTDPWWEAWLRVIAMARELAERTPIERWIEQAYNECDHDNLLDEGGPTTRKVRDACLRSVRAMGQFLDLRDDVGQPIVYEDFHLRGIRAMRQEVDPAEILWPYEHGKTVTSSITVPLLDMCEWHNSTSGRIYWSDGHARKWTGRLMQIVEHNDNLHRIFPWVQKPRKGDPCYGLWTQKGFAIAGRTIRDNTFEALTANTFATGNRYFRVGCDDWVTTGNAYSADVQEKLYEYFFTGPMTMRQDTAPRTSRYRTVWPGIFYCGTLFDLNDAGYRIYQFFQREGWRTLKFDVYPHGDLSRDRGEVLWPRRKPFSVIKQRERELGTRVFNMRMRNMVREGGLAVFAEEHVRAAVRQEYSFGVVPDNTRVLIGFDPGSGKVTKESKAPAYVVYGERLMTLHQRNAGILVDTRSTSTTEHRDEDDEYFFHLVEWNRMVGFSFTRQCDRIIERARHFGCTVVVEDNHVQTAYADYIRRVAPDVRVVTHTTGENKRDPKDGVEQWVPLLEAQRVAIHGNHAPLDQLNFLLDEFIRYPRNHYSDLLMASWIARYNARIIRRKLSAPSVTATPLPGYARFGGFRRFTLNKRVG